MDKFRLKLLGKMGKFSPMAVGILVNTAQNNKDGMRRARAIQILGSINNDRARQIVILGLQDDYLDAYKASVHAIAEWRNDHAINLLSESMHKKIADNDTVSARISAEVLASINRPEVIPPLFEVLGADWSWNRDGYHKLLISLGPTAIPPAIAALNGTDPKKREETVNILSGLGIEAVPPLLETLQNGPEASRSGAAKALGNLGDRRAVVPLISCTQEDNPKLQEAAAEALGKLKSPEAFEPLVKLTLLPTWQVRAAAAQSLGALGDRRAVEPLISLFEDEVLDVQVNAQKSLLQIGRPAQVALVACLHDPKELTRRQAGEILAQMGEDSLGPVLNALNNGDREVRISAAQALRLGKEEEAVLGLITALHDPDLRVRQTAAASLGEMKPPRAFPGKPSFSLEKALPELDGMLNRKNEAARQVAALALLKLGLEAVTTVVHSSLTSPRRGVRFAMTNALSTYFSSSVKDFPAWFRVTKSAYHMATSKQVEIVITDLISVSQEYDPVLRQTAIEALQAIQHTLRIKRELGEEDVHYFTPPIISKNGLNAPTAQEMAIQNVLSSIPLEPAPRYADVTFYADATPRTSIPEGQTLQVEKWYQLEVAIRQHPSGIPPDELLRRPIREPAQKKNVTIWVAIEGEGFEIKEPVSSLTLPPSGDSSDSAFFRVKPLRASTSKRDRASLQIRLYYAFNLLEVALVQVEVVHKFEDSSYSHLGLEHPLEFHQERLEQAYLDFDNVQPRIMHIDITHPGNEYQLNFAFYNVVLQKVEFSAPVRMKDSDIEVDLLQLRNLWYEIAMSKTFSQQLQGEKIEYEEVMHKLAIAGNRLWVDLFKHESQTALAHVRGWLEEHPLTPDGIIQISIAQEATGFLFPWAMLYDRPVPKYEYQLPDTKGFWGLRYILEQRLPLPQQAGDEPVETEGPLKVDFMLWEEFRNAAQEESYFQALQDSHPGKIQISLPPIVKKVECLEHLNQCEAHILYFYTHGYTRQRLEDIGTARDLQLFVKNYEALKTSSPAHQTYQLLYESIHKQGYEPDRDWIELSYGRLYLDELYSNINRLPSQPFVFLNMCESAQVLPSLSHSFIHFFLDRGARCVLGTECPMTVEFAQPFAQAVLNGLLAGGCIGEVLQHARCTFIDKLNPLGLAYTLFGPVTLRYPPVLEEPAVTQATSQ